MYRHGLPSRLRMSPAQRDPGHEWHELAVSGRITQDLRGSQPNLAPLGYAGGDGDGQVFDDLQPVEPGQKQFFRKGKPTGNAIVA